MVTLQIKCRFENILEKLSSSMVGYCFCGVPCGKWPMLFSMTWHAISAIDSRLLEDAPYRRVISNIIDIAESFDQVGQALHDAAQTSCEIGEQGPTVAIFDERTDEFVYLHPKRDFVKIGTYLSGREKYYIDPECYAIFVIKANGEMRLGMNASEKLAETAHRKLLNLPEGK